MCLCHRERENELVNAETKNTNSMQQKPYKRTRKKNSRISKEKEQASITTLEGKTKLIINHHKFCAHIHHIDMLLFK